VLEELGGCGGAKLVGKSFANEEGGRGRVDVERKGYGVKVGGLEVKRVELRLSV
jgi:hypothetical protein